MQDLLFLSHRIPYPPTKGDKIRSWNMFRHLSERYRVHLACLVDDPDDWPHAGVVRERCASHCIVGLNPAFGRLRSLTGLLDGRPLSLGYFHDRRIARWIDEVRRRDRPARAFVFCSAMAGYLMDAGCDGLHRVVDMVDVDSDKWRQYADRKRWPMRAVYAREGRTLLAFERAVAQRFAASLFVSDAEAALFRRLAPESAGRVHAVRNGVDFDFFSPEHGYENPFTGGETPIVFTGAMDYWPNVDAVNWFAREVLPLLARRRPDVRFYVVGSNPADSLQQLVRELPVTVTGRVPDVRPYIRHAAAVVAPLRVARGVQNKVLEGMAMGRAVVTSPQALEGIEAEPGRDVVLADGPAAFAEAVEGLWTGEADRRIGAAARAFVIERYGWGRSLADLQALLEGGTGPALRAAV